MTRSLFNNSRQCTLYIGEGWLVLVQVVRNYKRNEENWYCEHIIRNWRDQPKLQNGIAILFKNHFCCGAIRVTVMKLANVLVWANEDEWRPIFPLIHIFSHYKKKHLKIVVINVSRTDNIGDPSDNTRFSSVLDARANI